jgi:transcriptional regulator with XRE-family HTH domain
MDKRIISIIEKRKELDWSVQRLAKESNVSYMFIRMIEKDNQAFQAIVRDWGSIANELEVVLNNAKIKLRLNWSLKYDRCQNCGTQERKHRARGLCITCYSSDYEKKQKLNKRKRGIAVKTLTKDYLLEEYIEKKKSLNDIAKECQCSRQYVSKKLKEYEILARSKSSARRIALENHKLEYRKIDKTGYNKLIKHQRIQIDKHFFSSWSMPMAYVLGVIYSDGNLYAKGNLRRLTIGQKEPELLIKLRHLMKCDAKLYFSPKRGIKGELFTLAINSRTIFADLIKLGLFPDKSLFIDFPNIPQRYVRHFIRGCWDGDGSVYVEKITNQIRATFVSGSIAFIEGMLFELEKAGLKRRKIYTSEGKNPSYSFRYSPSDCKLLYHFLYDYVPSKLYLERKHKVFKDYFGVFLQKK